MTVVVITIAAVLVAAAAIALVRIVRGPSVLDRAVATEVLVSIAVCALGVEAATTRHSATLPILVSLSLVGFAGSVAVARFVGRDRDEPQKPESDRPPETDGRRDGSVAGDSHPPDGGGR